MTIPRISSGRYEDDSIGRAHSASRFCFRGADSIQTTRVVHLVVLGEGMRILRIIKALLTWLLLRLFPSLGPEGVINTQITVYQRLKKKFPSASENDLLNSLIMSRVKAPLSVSTPQEEYVHYEPMLQDSNKTLEDVILAIVEYEYILNREEGIARELSKMRISAQPTAVVEKIEECKRYIKESIEKLRVPTEGITLEFFRIKWDYKIYLLSFVILIVTFTLASIYTPDNPNSFLFLIAAVSSVMSIVYTIKILIDTVKIFKKVKPTTLQIILAVFLSCFFLSPLLLVPYVFYLIKIRKQGIF